jgi:DNA-binding NtrC family response regulator
VVASFLNCDPSVPPLNILVVDDEPLARWSVAETLIDSGYRVTQAGDALSALEAMNGKGGAADLVLLDLRLPDSSDLGVLSMMRRLSPTTPIILMTAYGSEALTAEARSRGAYAVINKPFDMSALPPLIAAAIQ